MLVGLTFLTLCWCGRASILGDIVREFLDGEGLATSDGVGGFYVYGGGVTVWVQAHSDGLVAAGFAGLGRSGKGLFDSADPCFFDALLAWVREHAG